MCKDGRWKKSPLAKQKLLTSSEPTRTLPKVVNTPKKKRKKGKYKERQSESRASGKCLLKNDARAVPDRRDSTQDSSPLLTVIKIIMM